MPSETVENYLKAVYALAERGGPNEKGAAAAEVQVAVGDIAAALDVTSGTVTAMLKKLAAEKLVRYERYGGVALTAKGRRIALAVLRRHRLVETFLVATLGMDWGEVHEEAERLEHALSDRLLERLDRFLGNPAFDPHGDPIPDADGAVRAAPLVAIARCKAGTRVRLARVLDQRAEFLQFLDRNGLRIGSFLLVDSFEPGAGTVTVRPERGPAIAVSDLAASNLMVERVAAGR